MVNIIDVVDRTGRAFTMPGSVNVHRKTLGKDAVRQLSDLTQQYWNQQANHPTWNGLTLDALDGVVWRTPDTPQNANAFG